jgi:histidinol phosphatase-like PHP family hydrolase
MISDIHSHTYYSACGRDNPEDLVLEMINQGVEIFGICDHNGGIADRRDEYLHMLSNLSEKYKDKIKILKGIEMNTLAEYPNFRTPPSSKFDYCLIEHLDLPSSIMKGDIVSFTKDYPCPKGIAHTDLFAFIENTGRDAYKYLKSLAEANIFWEMNVNYDSIHGYHEHQYVKRFFQNKDQQKIIKDAGLYISVGFDGHRMEDYLVKRVKEANDFILSEGINHAVNLIIK